MVIIYLYNETKNIKVFLYILNLIQRIVFSTFRKVFTVWFFKSPFNSHFKKNQNLRNYTTKRWYPYSIRTVTPPSARMRKLDAIFRRDKTVYTFSHNTLNADERRCQHSKSEWESEKLTFFFLSFFRQRRTACGSAPRTCSTRATSSGCARSSRSPSRTGPRASPTTWAAPARRTASRCATSRAGSGTTRSATGGTTSSASSGEAALSHQVAFFFLFFFAFIWSIPSPQRRQFGLQVLEAPIEFSGGWGLVRPDPLPECFWIEWITWLGSPGNGSEEYDQWRHSIQK